MVEVLPLGALKTHKGSSAELHAEESSPELEARRKRRDWGKVAVWLAGITAIYIHYREGWTQHKMSAK
jgi:hypothetical protein